MSVTESDPGSTANVYADRDAEQVLIGALVEGEERALAELKSLTPTDFTEERGEILKTVRSHVERGHPIDLVLIGGTLVDRGRADLIHEAASCSDSFLPCDTANLGAYVLRIRKLSAVRRLQREVATAWAVLRDSGLNLDERLRRILEELPPALDRVRKMQESSG